MSDTTIRVLIADDEVIIRRGLISTVPWERYGMEVVADAPNGTRAWEAFLEHEPEVVITDIVMPGMTGIELIRKIKEYAPRTKALLLSCHRDFEYAKQGIKYGASGYLLKTDFSDEELGDYLEGFRSELRRPGQQAPAKSGGAEVSDADKSVDVEGAIREWLHGIRDRFPAELERLLDGQWRWMREPTVPYLIGCGESGSGEGSDRGGACVDGGGPASAEAEALGATATPGPATCAARLAAGLASAGLCAVAALSGQHVLLLVPQGERQAWNARLCALKAADSQLRWTEGAAFAGASGWLAEVRSLHGRIELETRHRVRIGEWPEPIAAAVRLIVEQADSQLSVAEAAHEVGLSRSHFSTLFKRVVGESFVAFTCRTKLGIASELLAASKLTVQDIADRVGMPDAKYFSKWFKRCTGQTPSHYRTERRMTDTR
ncbi:helix-turn-helix domain-containing protein [Paenibacillus sp. GbtcB18]|uniref:response regulator transcription factor n=1 Tax=Paenibacillus sp. GbtcB18 TaxID=2824763 RepID=UPI001C30A65F|nr:helix-turn-helix domain-containing protein [Paenibacillus sp. GbtcB18]